MSGVRLPPDQRDRVIAVVEALCAGHARFDGAVVFGGHVIRPVELLARVAASGSADRFPALVVEIMTKAFGQPVSARTYAEAAVSMLVHSPRIQIMRDEAEAFERLARAELRAEAEARAKQAAKTAKLAAPAKQAA